MGLTSMGTTFVPVYGLTNAGNLADRTDIFATLASTIGAAASKDAGTSSMAGPPTEPLALTPELARAFAASVRSDDRASPRACRDPTSANRRVDERAGTAPDRSPSIRRGSRRRRASAGFPTGDRARGLAARAAAIPIPG